MLWTLKEQYGPCFGGEGHINSQPASYQPQKEPQTPLKEPWVSLQRRVSSINPKGASTPFKGTPGLPTKERSIDPFWVTPQGLLQSARNREAGHGGFDSAEGRAWSLYIQTDRLLEIQVVAIKMHIHIYIYMYICIYLHTYTHTKLIHMCIHIYTHACSTLRLQALLWGLGRGTWIRRLGLWPGGSSSLRV